MAQDTPTSAPEPAKGGGALGELDHAEVADFVWTFSGPIVAFVTLVLVLFLRRLLPVEKRTRGKVTLGVLVAAILLHGAALACDSLGFPVATRTISFVAILLQSFAMTGVVRMLLFDLLLHAIRVRIPITLQDIIQAIAYAVIAFAIMRARGVNIFSIITTSAVLTAVIGLALQSTIANVFAGLSLQMDRTIGVGDWIRADTHLARIVQIKWRSTQMLTLDGDLLTVPNAELIKNTVLNHSRPSPQHRVWLPVGFHYRHAPNEVMDVLLDGLTNVKGVLAQPPPDVVVTKFDANAIEYAIRFWIDDMYREDVIKSDVMTRVWYVADRAGLEIPFPIRTVHMHQVTEESRTRKQELEYLARLAVVARLDLFEGLEKQERELLARGMRRLTFTRGERIIKQGAGGDTLYFIHDGEVAVRLEVDGVEREVAVLKKGQFFGEMSLLTGEPRAASCVARTDVELYEIGHEPVKRLFDEKPAVAEEVAKVLATRQATLEGEREGLSAEARARRAAEQSKRVLLKIRDFFHLG